MYPSGTESAPSAAEIPFETAWRFPAGVGRGIFEELALPQCPRSGLSDIFGLFCGSLRAFFSDSGDGAVGEEIFPDPAQDVCVPECPGALTMKLFKRAKFNADHNECTLAIVKVLYRGESGLF
jgi:hypothetical protein